MIEEPDNLTLGFNFKKANWTKYEEQLNEEIGLIDSEHGIEEWNRSFSKYIWAEETISKKKVPRRGSMVPWWDEECNKAVHARNKAYKKLKRYSLESYVIEYKKLRARARRVIKEAKKKSCRDFCCKLGPETSTKEIWNLVHRMSGVCRQRCLSALCHNGEEAINNKEKADMLVKQFQKIHSSDNVSEENRSIREEVIMKQIGKLQDNSDNSDAINNYFTIKELK